MTTYFVWMLVVISNGAHSSFTVIDNISSAEQCEHVLKSLPSRAEGRCIQVQKVRP